MSVAGIAHRDQTPGVRSEPLPAPDVGDRIRALREYRGYSREEFAGHVRAATHAKTTTNTFGRWEAEGKLSVGELLAVAELLDVSPAVLLQSSASELDAEIASRLAELRAERVARQALEQTEAAGLPGAAPTPPAGGRKGGPARRAAQKQPRAAG